MPFTHHAAWATWGACGGIYQLCLQKSTDGCLAAPAPVRIHASSDPDNPWALAQVRWMAHIQDWHVVGGLQKQDPTQAGALMDPS